MKTLNIINVMLVGGMVFVLCNAALKSDSSPVLCTPVTVGQGGNQ